MCRPNNKISKAAAQAFIERRPFRSPSCAVQRHRRELRVPWDASDDGWLGLGIRKNWVLESTNEVVEVEV